ncbi:MAG TPA: O-antigen ligase family protein [Mycobacteriales bacterium]|nr:O-antigen ligase family protein [Mycobacteriales bacterium]
MAWAAAPVRGWSFGRLLAGPRRWLFTALFVALVYFFASGGPVSIALVLGLSILSLTIALASRRPQFAVLGIAFWMPLQVPILAFAYKHGVPRMVVKDLGYLKEFWAISLVIAALRATRQRHIKADLLDWLAVGYVGVVTLYFILPFADPSALGGLSLGARLSAWRLECLYVVVFLCIRRLTFDPIVIRRLRFVVFAVAIVLAGFAFWESASNSGFNNFLRNTLDYPGYRGQVLGNQLAGNDSGSLISTTVSGKSTYVRGGSLFNDPLVFGYFMVIPFGIAVERVASSRSAIIASVVSAGALLGVFLSVTRGAVVAAGIIVVLALVFGISRVSRRRLRLVLTILLAGAVLLPVAGHSAVFARMKSIIQPSADPDTEAHVTRTSAGVKDLIHHPLGHGLGTNNTTGVLYSSATVVNTEDSYLETGTELGVVAMLLFLGTLLAALAKLRERAKRPGEAAGLAGGAWLAGCGLAIGASVLQTWYELPVTMVFWTIAGLALADTGTAELPETAGSGRWPWLQ